MENSEKPLAKEKNGESPSENISFMQFAKRNWIWALATSSLIVIPTALAIQNTNQRSQMDEALHRIDNAAVGKLEPLMQLRQEIQELRNKRPLLRWDHERFEELQRQLDELLAEEKK